MNDIKTCEGYVLYLLKQEQDKNNQLVDEIIKSDKEKKSMQATIVNLELRIDELMKEVNSENIHSRCNNE